MSQETNLSKQVVNQSPRFSFYYLLSLISLIFIAIPAGLIAFQLINKWLPDPLIGYTAYYSFGSLKFGLSALLIAVPVYFWSTRQINQGLIKKDLDPKADLRRWLIYFILLVTAVVMLGWLIAIFYRYLDGEITSQFLTKSAVALMIAAVIFCFYRYDLGRDPLAPKASQGLAWFTWPSIVAILFLFIAGLLVVESPKQARFRRYDQQLIGQFYQIDRALNDYYQRYQVLPTELSDLWSDYYFLDQRAVQVSDGSTIEYQVIGEDRYQLCATWYTSNLDDYDGVRSLGLERWPHSTGYQCLEQVVWSEESDIKAYY